MLGVLLMRADATSRIGTGHVMRSLALAQAWKARGGTATFLSHCESRVIREHIESAGIGFVPLGKPHPDPGDLQGTLEILKQFEIKNSELKFQNVSVYGHQKSFAPPWVTLDGYHLTTDYQRAICNAGARVLVIDDMAHLPYYHAHVLVNQNVHAESLKYKGRSETVFLRGPKYFLLRQEFFPYRSFKKEFPGKAGKLLVTMGGADPNNITLKVMEALKILDHGDLEVTVVVGPANSNLEIIRREAGCLPFPSRVMVNVQNMPELMIWAEMAICSGGTTVSELAFLGVPCVVGAIALNQAYLLSGLDKIGLCKTIGWYADLSSQQLADIFSETILDREARLQMRALGQSTVDGKGIERLINVMACQN